MPNSGAAGSDTPRGVGHVCRVQERLPGDGVPRHLPHGQEAAAQASSAARAHQKKLSPAIRPLLVATPGPSPACRGLQGRPC